MSQAVAVERFTEVARQVHEGSGAPGLTAAFITSDGAVQSIAMGMADTEAGTPMTPTSRMPGGSTGKTIVAATALSQVGDGLVTLDGPLSTWLGDRPWFPRLPNAADLTLRNLLSHSSGLPDHMGLPDTLPYLIEMRRTRGPDWYCPPVEAVGMVLDLPPIAPANRTFFYSDTNYILAALALEAASGRPLNELQVERVLAPLGIEDVEPALKRHFDHIAPGYTNAPEGSPLPRKTIGEDGGLVYSPRTEWAGGGMVSGAPGLARFIRAYASGRAFDWPYLDEVKKLVRYSWVENQVGGYGVGVFATASPLGPTLGHGGYYPGYLTQMTYFPDHDLAVAYQTNYSFASSSYAAIVAKRVEDAKTVIDPQEPLTGVTDWSVKLAAAVLDRTLPG